MKPNAALFDAARTVLDTGDIVLFAGNTPFSTAIETVTNSRWTHVGMIVKTSKHPVLLWESLPFSKVPDVQLCKCLSGVQLVPFQKRLETHVCDVTVRRLIWKRTPIAIKHLSELQKELKGRPYEWNLFELTCSAYDGPLGENVHDLSSVFCSELVAEAYMRLGLLPSDDPHLPSNEFVPGDFAEARALQLLGGARLGPEVPLALLIEQSEMGQAHQQLDLSCLEVPSMSCHVEQPRKKAEIPQQAIPAQRQAAAKATNNDLPDLEFF